MIVKPSTLAANSMLDVLAEMMDGGSIVVLSDNESVLAVLRLSIPAAQEAVGRELVFNDIAEEDAARAQGTATTARIVGSDGAEIFACDVGDEKSDAVIKLNTTKIYRGGPVRLRSFRLVMP